MPPVLSRRSRQTLNKKSISQETQKWWSTKKNRARKKGRCLGKGNGASIEVEKKSAGLFPIWVARENTGQTDYHDTHDPHRNLPTTMK